VAPDSPLTHPVLLSSMSPSRQVLKAIADLGWTLRREQRNLGLTTSVPRARYKVLFCTEGYDQSAS
jgi:hypothetical protein